jgi:hypothetical protein
MGGRIVLFGATGYTGTLTAEELATARVAAVPAGARGPVEAFGLDVVARALAGAGLPEVTTRRRART